MWALPVLEDAETSPFRLQHGYSVQSKVISPPFSWTLLINISEHSEGVPFRWLALLCLVWPRLFLSLSLLLNYLYPSSSLRSQTDSSLSSPSTITRLYLPSQELLQLQQNHANTLTPQTPITNQHHQHACLRVLLPVWRHDSHQHHLHCLRPQAMQQLPSVLKHSPTDTSRRHFPPLSSLLSHNTRLELYHDKGLQHGEMRVWIPSLIRDTTFFNDFDDGASILLGNCLYSIHTYDLVVTFTNSLVLD